MARAELIVVEDLPDAGVRLFLETAPRTVALSGGSTPRALYEELSRADFAWQSLDMFFGDERCVSASDPDSNFRMANEALLSKVPARAHPMCDCDPEAYESELGDVFGPARPSFDLVWLGLGEDGHTASLFPGDPALDVTDRNVVRVDRPDHARMTLTLPVLCAARLAVFLVSGPSKREPLARLLAGADIPAARVDAERTLILADRAAAG